MKANKIFILFLLLFSLIESKAQIYLTTPNGSSVYALNRGEEFTTAEIVTYTNNTATSYPQATVLANATKTYNCHSYAWNMTQGGPTCWLNASPDLHKYWDDYSYFEVNSTSAKKIYYYNSDHSAVVSTVAGMYDSKWGSLPVMRHSPDYGPYNSMGTRKYYDRTLTLTSISGPTSPGLNTGGVYSVSPSLPAGAGTYQWLTPSNAVISGSGPSVTINFQSAGSYLVKCRHINNSGNAGSFISMTVTVSNISYIASSNGKFVYVSLQNNNGVQVAKQTVAYSLFIQSSGVLVASGKMPISGGTLDFSNVSGGIYILQIEIGVNSIETYRIFLK